MSDQHLKDDGYGGGVAVVALFAVIVMGFVSCSAEQHHHEREKLRIELEHGKGKP